MENKISVYSILIIVVILSTLENYNFQTFPLNNTNQSLNSYSDSIGLPIIKSDFLINAVDGEYGCEQYEARVAIDGKGNYGFTWVDERIGIAGIYVQFFDKNDNELSNILRVNDREFSRNSNPFITCNKNGVFVITWLQNYGNVMAQKFINAGSKIERNIYVNDGQNYSSLSSSVAVSSDDSFMITWGSEQNHLATVYAKLFNKMGYPLEPIITVSEELNHISMSSIGKHIAVDEEQNYCITWSSNGGEDKSKIIAQLIDGDGNLIFKNKIISEAFQVLNNNSPQITGTDSGEFLISWNSNGGVVARIYNKNGSFNSDEYFFRENHNSYSRFQISSDRDSTFYILLGNSRSNYIRKIKSSGELLDNIIQVNEKDSSQNYFLPNEITDIHDNEFVIAYNGTNLLDENIYRQRINLNDNPNSSFYKIFDDFGISPQIDPLVKFNSTGRSIIIWEDHKNGGKDIYAQVLDKDFNPVSENIRINDVGNLKNSFNWNTPIREIISLSNGTFVVAFSGIMKNWNNGIWLQSISKEGIKLGANTLVYQEERNDELKISLQISNDEIFLFWYNVNGIFLNIFDLDLKPKYSENKILKQSNNNRFDPVTISVDQNYNIFAVWGERNKIDYSSNQKVHGEFFDKEGISISEKFIVDKTSDQVISLFSQNNGEDYVVIIGENNSHRIKRKYTINGIEHNYSNNFNSCYANNSSIKIQKFENRKIFFTSSACAEVMGYFINDNQHTFENFKIYEKEGFNDFQYSYNLNSSLDLYDTRLLVAYESDRNFDTNTDIWAKVIRIDSLNFEKEYLYKNVNTDYLYNNYPNPFNSRTKIIYQILAFHDVKLTVYDILGREVEVLVNEKQEKGIYEVEFNSIKLSSGVYFYKLDAFDTKIKKMMILK